MRKCIISLVVTSLVLVSLAFAQSQLVAAQQEQDAPWKRLTMVFWNSITEEATFNKVGSARKDAIQTVFREMKLTDDDQAAADIATVQHGQKMFFGSIGGLDNFAKLLNGDAIVQAAWVRGEEMRYAGEAIRFTGPIDVDENKAAASVKEAVELYLNANKAPTPGAFTLATKIKTKIKTKVILASDWAARSKDTPAAKKQ